MNPLKPLLFLTYRTIFNGIRRALTTPRRLIAMIVFIGYYFFVFVRPALMQPSGSPGGQLLGKIDFPAPQQIDAIAFTVLSFLSLIMLMGLMGFQGNFRPADVDVLFPTPVNPKIVLFFRIIRDYMFTLLFPLMIALFGLRPAKASWELVFRNMPNPGYSGMAVKMITITWVLMALSWVSIGYAVGFYVNRNDANGDRNRKIVEWSIAALGVGIIAFAVRELTSVHSFNDFVRFTESPVLRGVFFLAAFGTKLTTAPFSDHIFLNILIGAGSLIAVIVLSMRLALSQISYMYDQAAIKAFKVGRTRDLARSGDYMAVMAERARVGKKKTRKKTWVNRIRMQGPLALYWKELLLQPRSMLGLLLIMTISGIFMVSLPAFDPSSEANIQAEGFVFLLMLGITLFMITLSLAQTGFVEVLRRVDLLKPMPFSSQSIVICEVASKGTIGVFSMFTGSVVVLILKPALWQFVVTGLVFGPFLSLLLSSCVFLVTILFPDVDDPSQRQFRGLMMILCFAFAGVLPIGTFAGLVATGYFTAAAILGSFFALLITITMSILSGRLYATYNASE